MRKNTFNTFLAVLFLLTGTLPVWAQAPQKVVSNVVKGMGRKSVVSRVRVPKPVVPSVQNVPVTPRVSVPAMSKPVVAPKPAAVPTPSLPVGTAPVPVPTTTTQNLSQIVEASLVNHTIPEDAYIFQARETDDLNTPTNIFSGTVFSTTYNGKEEVYGVVATHAIATSTFEKNALHRNFKAVVYKNGIQRIFPVEIVASSPQSMLDISLVKFPEEALSILRPYQLGTLGGDKILHSEGFTGVKPTAITQRELVACTPNSIRTTIPLPREQRPGLCGSAVLNSQNELVGIHTGSLGKDKVEDTHDIAYATPANFLNNLVEAYHNGGKADIPFMIENQPIFMLNVDEFISYVQLMDENGKKVWAYTVPDKFSYSKFSSGLKEHPQARFLQLNTRVAAWDETGYAFIENRNSPRVAKLTYVYDLQEGKLVKKMLKDINPANNRPVTRNLLADK